jgi:hypothetical protein
MCFIAGFTWLSCLIPWRSWRLALFTN